MTRILTVIVLSLCSLAVAHGGRIKDLTNVEGDRDNQLIGYGIVVGLAGDGDSNAATTLRSVANVLQRFGLALSPQDIKAKNVAAVMITANISAFLKPGARIDVTISSMGDAKTLQGGVLLQTPLLGADSRAYAVAQGALTTGGFIGGSGGAGGATVQKNHPTVGTITGGAIVEREIPVQLVHNNTLRLLLHDPDYTSASRMVDAINAIYPQAALAPDSATVTVHLPPEFAGREVPFISELGTIEVTPDTLARIVINPRTGTIVATSNVRLSHVAIAHGSITITVTSNVGVSQPNAFSSGGSTVAVPSTQVNVNEQKGGFSILNEQPTIERLAAALNALGVSTRDMMAIFQTIKQAGALQAELVVN